MKSHLIIDLACRCRVGLAPLVLGLLATVFPNEDVAIAAPPRYAIVDINPVGHERSVAYAINNHGTIVLGVGPLTNTFPGTYYQNRPFLYHNGAYTELSTSGSSAGWAWNIGDGGHVVGAVWPNEDRVFGALYQGSTVTEIPTFGGNSSRAFDVNAAGLTVGWSENPAIDNRAYIYDPRDGSMTNLGTLAGNSSTAWAINDHGQVAGVSTYQEGSNARHAFLYSEGVMTDLGDFGGLSSEARDLNEWGQVVGFSNMPYDGSGTIHRHGFLYDNGRLIDLGTFGGNSSDAFAINDLGHIIGYAMDPNGDSQPFLYCDNQLLPLRSLIDTSDEWSILRVLDINNRGQIVGVGVSNGELHAILLNPVPEPTTFAAALLAVTVLATRRGLLFGARQTSGRGQ